MRAHLFGEAGQYWFFVPYEKNNPDDPFDDWGEYVATLHSNVTTKDLKNPWRFRFFANTYECTHLEVHEERLSRVRARSVSWNSLPTVWKDLLAPELDKYFYEQFPGLTTNPPTLQPSNKT